MDKQEFESGIRKEFVRREDHFRHDSRGIKRNSMLTSHLNQLSMDILDHGYFVGNQQWNQFDVVSPFGRVYLMIADNGWLDTSSGRMDLLPGRMYLIPPYARVNLRTEQRIEKLYFHFSLKYAGVEVLEGVGQCLDLPMNDTLLSQFIQAFRGGSIPDLLEFKSLAYASLAQFIRAGLPGLDRRLQLADSYKDIFSFIERNLSASLNGRQVCQDLGYSYETMRRRFRQDNGITFNQYINGRIVQAASMNLLLTRRTIQQIAADLGFSDEFYFSRMFKKKMEYSPREYRRINAVLRSL